MVKYLFLFLFLLLSTATHAESVATQDTTEQPPATNTINTNELTCLATAIYYEANHSNVEMQEAVASVIINRVEDNRYPKTICGVIHQRSHRVCQFSWYCNSPGSINHHSLADIMVIAKQILQNWISDKDYDTTNGATHFHDTSVRPRWSSQLQRTLSIGNLRFYK